MIDVVTYRILGKSPLMVQNPAAFITDEDKKALATKKKYVSEEEAALRVYYLVDNELLIESDPKKLKGGKFVFPASAFRRSLMTAVSGRKFGKKSARMVLAGAVFPSSEWISVLDEKLKPVKGYELDKRSVVINKARILRVRPKWTDWRMTISFEVDTELVSAEQVKEALDLAGRIIGIGEFRPDPSGGKSGIGSFGRFTAQIVTGSV